MYVVARPRVLPKILNDVRASSASLVLVRESDGRGCEGVDLEPRVGMPSAKGCCVVVNIRVVLFWVCGIRVRNLDVHGVR